MSAEDIAIESFLIEDLVSLEYKQAFAPVIAENLISEGGFFDKLNPVVMEKALLSVFNILEKQPEFLKNFKVVEISRLGFYFFLI